MSVLDTVIRGWITSGYRLLAARPMGEPGVGTYE